MFASKTLFRLSALLALTAGLNGCGGSLAVLPAVTDQYTLPLKLSQNLECDGGSQLIYEISASGEFRFMASETPAKPVFITRQLSAADQADLDKLIESADLEARQSRLAKVPADAPQTAECRAIDTLTVKHTTGEKAYARNGRNLAYTKDYLDAWASVRGKLDALKTKYAPTPGGSSPLQSFAYALPLRVDVLGECQMGDYLRYEVTADGRFRFRRQPAQPALDNSQPPLEERQLSEAEKAALLQVLKEVDLARLALDDKPVPADAGQTADCRSMNLLKMSVDGREQSFEHISRKTLHTRAYLDAYDKLLKHLQTLMDQGPAAVQSLYGFPLKVRLDGECGLPDYTRYAIDAQGEFTWAREDLPTFAPGNPPMQSRKLSQSELSRTLDRLNELQVLKLAAGSQVVPADAPQTKECRTVTVYDLSADGKAQSLEGEGTRKFVHSKELLDKLAQLQAFLKELSANKTE